MVLAFRVGANPIARPRLPGAALALALALSLALSSSFPTAFPLPLPLPLPPPPGGPPDGGGGQWDAWNRNHGIPPTPGITQDDPILLLARAGMQQAEILKEQLDLQKQQAGRERDRSLKVDHKLVKVGHNSLGQVPFEIMNLERQMQEENVKTWKDWYKYFLAALCEAARTWIEGAQTREPFRAIIQSIS